jgi:hypothetical protein
MLAKANKRRIKRPVSRSSGSPVWRENQVPNFFPNALDESRLFDFHRIPLFFVSCLSCTSAMAFNLRPSLSTISGIPTKAFPRLGWLMDLAVPSRRIGHAISISRLGTIENHTKG